MVSDPQLKVQLRRALLRRSVRTIAGAIVEVLFHASHGLTAATTTSVLFAQVGKAGCYIPPATACRLRGAVEKCLAPFSRLHGSTSGSTS
jgi:hypothetical protein